jgi:hypothetical protein
MDIGIGLPSTIPCSADVRRVDLLAESVLAPGAVAR